MWRNRTRYGFAFGLAIALSPAMAAPVSAQVSKTVVVGVTPTCPYGLGACAAGAREGLKRLEGVRLVANAADTYNCTFEVRLESESLPDLDRWRHQFKEVVGEAFVFRGVEITVTGTVAEQDGVVILDVKGLRPPIALAPLEHKLQWHFRKRTARQPEPAEADAYRHLRADAGKAGSAAKFEITGPLRTAAHGAVLEVRDYFLSKDP
jgi:galactose oxidase